MRIGVFAQSGALSRLWKRKSAVFGLCLVLFLVIVTVLAPVLAKRPPNRQVLMDQFLPPGSEGYLLGTDIYGRDIFSRILWGGRISLVIALGAVLFGVTLGAILGLVAGYYGGRVDTVISAVNDVLLAFPMLLLAILLMSILGEGLRNLIIAIGLANVPRVARLVRSTVLELRDAEYVAAAKAAGSGDVRIAWNHLLPNILAPLIVMATARVSIAILTEATLSYLGMGIRPPTATWGTMIADGRGFLRIAPWVAMVPGAAIMAAVLGANLFGDGLRDALDPRLRGSGDSAAGPR